MERQDCHTSARFESIRQFFHKFIQDLKLAVYVDTQRLEYSLAGLADGIFTFFFRNKRKCLLDNLTQFCRSIYTISPADLVRNCFCNLLTIWLIGIFIKHSGKFISADRIKSLCRADSLFLIQSKIKRSVCAERKTTLRIVNLHGRYPKVCKNKIKSTGFFCNLIDRTEILKFNRQNVLSKALLCQTLTGLC